MSLKERIEKDIELKIKERKNANNLKLILGEIQRLPEKNPTDDDIASVLKRLYKNEEKLQKITKSNKSKLMELLESYISREEKMTEDEIYDWLTKNVNFEGLTNKMAAIKVTLNNLGSRVNGKTVKKVITEKF